jgi:hypothetical protein
MTSQQQWKGHEFVADMAVGWAFEIIRDNELKEFMQKNMPEVNFIYSDSNGPGSITVKYNGRYWIITD